MFDYPGDLRPGQSLPERREGRKRMDDVSDASKFYDQNSHSVVGQTFRPICGTNMDRREGLSYLKRSIISDVE